jgi:sugar phosphate isomerase/epimerase
MARIGLATGACPEAPILEMLPAFALSGASGLEIGTPPRHFDVMSRDQVGALQRALSAGGLRVVSMHAPFGGLLDLAAPSPHHRATAIDGIAAAATALRQFGGSIIVVHPSDLERHHHDVGARLADSASSINTLADRCRDLGVRVAVESPLPHLIGGHPHEFATILDALAPDVGVCLDTGHTTLAGHWHGFVTAAGTRLIHVHAHDNHGYADDHLAPGDGVINWTDIRASLDAASYTGWIMIELHCPPADPRAYFKRAVDQTRVRLSR